VLGNRRSGGSFAAWLGERCGKSGHVLVTNVAAIMLFQNMRMAQNGLMAEVVGASAQAVVLMHRLSIHL